MFVSQKTGVKLNAMFTLYLYIQYDFAYLYNIVRNYKLIEQKGMTFDHDFGYSFSIFSSYLKIKNREEEKENEKQ